MYLFMLLYTHGWPSTQPNRIAHSVAAHHQAANQPSGSVVRCSFCCRTTWRYVYGCTLVKLRKLVKHIFRDQPFISNWVKRKLRSENVSTFDLQCTHSCNFYLFHLSSKRIKSDWLETLEPSMADLLHMTSLEGLLLDDYDVKPTHTM